MLRKIIQGLRVKRGVLLVWQASPKWFVWSIAITLLASIEPVIGLYLLKILFDYLSDGFANNTEIVISTLSWLIVAITTTELFGLLLGNASKYISNAQGEKVQDHVMLKLHKKSAELDLSYYERPDYYDSLHLAQMTNSTSGEHPPPQWNERLITTINSSLNPLLPKNYAPSPSEKL